MKRFFGKLLSFLRVRPTAGGLEVSDQALRLAYYTGKEAQMVATVLGPGVMEHGVIKDPAALAAALAALRIKVPALKHKGKRMGVVVSLSSVPIYTQSFTLPEMSDDELKKAVDLNIQMSSPDDLKKSYFGSRVLSHDEENARLEISAAFIDKKIVDDIVEALFAAGFVTTGVESRAISLARVMRERTPSLDPKGSYVLANVDGAGLDLLVIKRGELYFEYAVPWTDVEDDKGQVSIDKFGEMVSMSLRQVLNFYRQHWQDPLAGIIVSSVGLQEQTQKAAAGASELPVLAIAPAESKVPPEWLVAFGACLRESSSDTDKPEINLAGEVAAERYSNEQMLNFLELWRALVPAALAICVVTLALAYNFLSSTATQVALTESTASQGAQEAETERLEASSTMFNQDVQLMLAAQSHADAYHKMFDEINEIAASSSVAVSRITFQGQSSGIQLSGVAPTEQDIIEFQNLVNADPNFGQATLPLSAITPAADQYSFSIAIPLAANAFR